MLSNILQKPLGIVAILGTAVGGPYAAFETEVGTQLRQSLMGRLAQTTNGAYSNSANLPNSDSSRDPFSLNADSVMPSGMQSAAWGPSDANRNVNAYAASSAAPNSPGSIASNSGASSSGAYNPGTYNPGVSNSGAYHSNAYAPTNGQIVSTVYGPVTVQPIGPPTSMAPAGSWPQSQSPSISYPNPLMEARVGTANVVPGRTDQLWDYTLGSPTLGQIQQQPNVAIGGGTVPDLREVLRFDIVPGWLPQRFARVTTVTSNVKMDGLRVPLITGTQPKDIAGSLTYYFDASHVLKRIHLHGLTGDPTTLANLMVQYYQLRPEQSLGGQLFTTRWNNRITSVMHVAPAPIIYAGADHSKYILFLELNQPDNQYGLSEEASEILRTAQATQRW